jgi:hypothetical protein
MPIEISISDEATAGFSEPAKSRVEEAAKVFAIDLIDEANRLEAGRNIEGCAPEVTRGMVTDADAFLRRGLYSPKKNKRLKALRIAAGVLPLAVGIMYDKQRLQDSAYMMFFFLVVAATILAVTLSVLKE